MSEQTYTYTSRITHTFSALCIHTIQFGRVTGTARKLAEHRAQLCLLGLKELQKSWDLENWVLDLFFRSLDDRTARDLRLADVNVSPSTTNVPGGSRDIAPVTASSEKQVISPPDPVAPLPAISQMTTNREPTEEAAINMDWYELFNMECDGIGGTLSNPDYLNPQNLDFLYRFL